MLFSSTPFVVGNWKMNGTAGSLGEIEEIAAGVAAGEAGRATCAICPPATLVWRAVQAAGPRLAIGGQDCAPKVSGAHTGDVSAEMLRDAGASLVIVGHSERRADYGESDGIVQAKAAAALRAGLLAIICVGETRAERDQGQAMSIVGDQLAGSLPEGATSGTVVLAYEPIWAIGTGLVPTVADVAEMHAFIRSRLEALVGEGGSAMRILYGGSVKPENAGVLMGIANVDGALIGGASLKARDFLGIAAVYR